MKKWISRGILCLSVPAVVIGGAWLFPGRRWVWGALCVVLLACAAVFLRFERKPADAKRLILIAALTALSVLGRILFAPIPSFKPVTAMVVITAMYFGSEAGFLTGALSAILSNIWFGQGAWTPFQMFAWGFVGFLAGLLAAPLKKAACCWRCTASSPGCSIRSSWISGRCCLSTDISISRVTLRQSFPRRP